MKQVSEIYATPTNENINSWCGQRAGEPYCLTESWRTLLSGRKATLLVHGCCVWMKGHFQLIETTNYRSIFIPLMIESVSCAVETLGYLLFRVRCIGTHVLRLCIFSIDVIDEVDASPRCLCFLMSTLDCPHSWQWYSAVNKRYCIRRTEYC